MEINLLKKLNVNEKVRTEVYKASVAELSQGKKIISFLGDRKVGTSFLVNNIAAILAHDEKNVAILDLTTNKGDYFMYTNNDSSLRKNAKNGIKKLEQGVCNGIKVNKHLTVFTSVPKEKENSQNVEKILESLLKNYDVILMDCDFNTYNKYYMYSQEIYLVQSMDITSIHPLTEKLLQLKDEKILDESKIKVVVNKYFEGSYLHPEDIVGSLAYYNDPEGMYMREIFNKKKVETFIVPFDKEVYFAYLNDIIVSEIRLNRYSYKFISEIEKISNNFK